MHAPNVHTGGGRALLHALAIADAGRINISAIVDSRLELPRSLSERFVDTRVEPTVLGRLSAERRLTQLAGPGVTVLCFGNLPPLLRCRGRILLFLQNRYLTEGLDHSGFSLRTRLRIACERKWLRSRIGGVEQVIVQTPSMAKEVEQSLGVKARVLAFAPGFSAGGNGVNDAESGNARKIDFLYIASGEPHKNHKALLNAWSLLASEGIKPGLCITLAPDLYPELVGWIDEKTARDGLCVDNVGQVSAGEVHRLYRRSRALVYPSLGESFGLPLIEASGHGLPVIAPEMDYVRDVVAPVQTFDPNSCVSIARAVKRFLEINQPPMRLLTPQQFLEALLPT